MINLLGKPIDKYSTSTTVFLSFVYLFSIICSLFFCISIFWTRRHATWRFPFTAKAEILLKKLHKAGKNADLVPEIPDPVENKPHDPKKKNKKKKEEKSEITDKVTSPGSDKPESEKPDGAGKCSSGDNSEACVPVKEDKCEILKKKDSAPADSSLPSLVDSPASTESPAPTAEKKAEESSGSVGKKKKKKGQSMSNVNNPTGGPARTRSLPSPTTTPASEDHDRSNNQHDGHQMLTNNITPRQDMYPYPPNYYAPQIMYGVSYNVAQPPVSVDAASYYSPATPHSYAYMHPGYLPSDQNPYPSRPSDSFELFSDENPNGCSVMWFWTKKAITKVTLLSLIRLVWLKGGLVF